MIKYKFTGETKLWCDRTLHRIRALIDIDEHGVKKGDLGGWVEKVKNLSQDGAAWVGDEAIVCDAATVIDDALVAGMATISEAATISGKASVKDAASISGSAVVSGKAAVKDAVLVSGDARIIEKARASGAAVIDGVAVIRGSARVGSTTQYLTIGNGNGSITFFVDVNGKIMVACRYFYGDIDKFAEQLKATHGDSKLAKACLAAVELAKIQIDISAVDNVVIIP